MGNITGAVVLGGQWGDEGKGRVVDRLITRFLEERPTSLVYVLRFNGSGNAGHTVVGADGVKRAVHAIPVGALRRGDPRVMSVIGPGALVDPIDVYRELQALGGSGIPLEISSMCHVITPYHKAQDGQEEESRGSARIGTTLRGNGPAYADRASRKGITLQMAQEGIDQPGWRTKWSKEIAARWNEINGGAWQPEIDLWLDAIRQISPYVVQGIPHIPPNASIIWEGAHGAGLDIATGDYPNVSSSTCTIGGAAAGGFPPRRTDMVLGVFKPYSSRVGAGDIPEMAEHYAKPIRDFVGEYGTTTGRPRRLGWFNREAFWNSVMANYYDGLVVNCLDAFNPLFLDDDPALFMAIRYNSNSRYYRPLRWAPVTSLTLPKEVREFLQELSRTVPVIGYGVGPKPEDFTWLDSVWDQIDRRLATRPTEFKLPAELK